MIHNKFILFLILLFTFSLACNTADTTEEFPATTTIYQGPLGNPYTDQYGIEFIWIQPGSFMMGALDGEGPHYGEVSLPVHDVIISKGFYLGKYELTQGQAHEISNHFTTYHQPSHIGPYYPIDNLDDPDFVNTANYFNTTHTYLYRLPTEAEWEYSARAGTDTLYYWGNDTTLIDNYEWYGVGLSIYDSTHPVGQKLPNPWGLHDMLGNVSEFVLDKYDITDYYNGYDEIIRIFGDPAIDPLYDLYGRQYIIRGGAYIWRPGHIFYCSYRYLFNYQEHVGLRLVIDVYDEGE